MSVISPSLGQTIHQGQQQERRPIVISWRKIFDMLTGFYYELHQNEVCILLTHMGNNSRLVTILATGQEEVDRLWRHLIYTTEGTHDYMFDNLGKFDKWLADILARETLTKRQQELETELVDILHTQTEPLLKEWQSLGIVEYRDYASCYFWLLSKAAEYDFGHDIRPSFEPNNPRYTSPNMIAGLVLKFKFFEETHPEAKKFLNMDHWLSI